MNHFGTLSALNSLLISNGIVLHRCRRRFDDEQRYYLEDAATGDILRALPYQTYRRGYTLSEILNWLHTTAEHNISQSAYSLLTQLDYANTAIA